ncbi:hypothetical protein Q5752_005238 [Cryptotrichosporon argae]
MLNAFAGPSRLLMMAPPSSLPLHPLRRLSTTPLLSVKRPQKPFVALLSPGGTQRVPASKTEARLLDGLRRLEEGRVSMVERYGSARGFGLRDAGVGAGGGRARGGAGRGQTGDGDDSGHGEDDQGREDESVRLHRRPRQLQQIKALFRAGQDITTPGVSADPAPPRDWQDGRARYADKGSRSEMTRHPREPLRGTPTGRGWPSDLGQAPGKRTPFGLRDGARTQRERDGDTGAFVRNGHAKTAEDRARRETHDDGAAYPRTAMMDRLRGSPSGAGPLRATTGPPRRAARPLDADAYGRHDPDLEQASAEANPQGERNDARAAAHHLAEHTTPREGRYGPFGSDPAAHGRPRIARNASQDRSVTTWSASRDKSSALDASAADADASGRAHEASPDAPDRAPARWDPTRRLAYPTMAAIRAAHAEDPATWTYAALGKKFGVSFEAARRICRADGRWRTGAGAGTGPGERRAPGKWDIGA